jgi:hypothetical protein
LRKVDRQFHWVHPDLYEIDLHGIPTLIVQFSVDHKLLGIHLGGCHVSSDGVDEMHKVHGLRFPGTAQWTEEALALFGYDPKPPADDRELLELNHDLAARLINICLVTALDAYYLLRRRAYAEQFDEAIEAAGIFGDDWPTDLGVDLGLGPVSKSGVGRRRVVIDK